MGRTITIVVLAIALVAVGFWGYQEHQEKNAISIQSENHYQQVFHNLVYHMDELHDQIGSTLAMSSSHSLSPALAHVWRLASVAHNEVGQLPLALMPFNDTQAFLSKIGNYSYQVSTRNLNKKPLNDQEYKTLQTLYKRSGDIEKELRRTQAIASKKNLRWMDVKMALASGQEPMDNAIIDGFKTVNKTVQGYDGINWGPENAQMAKERGAELQHLKGRKISKSEALKIAKQFLGYGKNQKATVTSTGKGSNYPVYNVSMKNPKTGSTVHLDITKTGGHPVWMIQDRQAGKPKIGLHKAEQIASKYLKQHGKNQMVMTESEQYDDVGIFTFVKEKNHTRIYPESIRMKVSLNHGRVVGYDATDYLAFKKTRHFGKPKLSKKQALKHINENVNVKIVRPAVVTNDIGKEVLCYEVLGTINNDTYRIFVNANTGQEEKVKKLHNPTPIYRGA
ncbi:MAG TPA: germination protein YpeB [Bacillales bacterium]|nr:germination protein YpeB [Bacillales bacterium]